MKNIIRTDIIEDFMKKNNLSTEQFCDRCGIMPTDMAMINEGNQAVEINVLFKIAGLLGIKVAELLCDGEN